MVKRHGRTPLSREHAATSGQQAPLDTGELLGDRFELGEEAGAGGMSTVHRARDLSTGKPVAIKLLRGRRRLAVERFDREARVLSELSHPRIVQYIAHGTTHDGRMYLAMEWLEGEDLERRLARGRL